MRRREKGFTLIELMIAVVIIGILASIAYPSYTGYVEKSRRAEAQSILVNVAGALERCYTNSYSYSNCSAATKTISEADSESNYYTYSLADETGTFSISASPKGAQWGDACGTLSIDETGETNGTRSDCW